MIQPWKIGDKSGNISYPKGEVVYQHEPNVRVEPIYETLDGKRYIHTENGLQEVTTNPFNGYCYRQDGQ